MLNPLIQNKNKKADMPPEDRKDVLLEALVFITGYFGHTRSAPALQAGLPIGKEGLTPKLFCRVQRFQKVLRRIRTGREVDWTGVALDSGYFDQAHFIHDFKAFSGLSPTAYAAHRTEHLNHVPILD